MPDIIMNVSEYMRENIRDVNVDTNEKEVLAYISMALYKMFLIGETSHKWSDDFRKLIADFPNQFKELIKED